MTNMPIEFTLGLQLETDNRPARLLATPPGYFSFIPQKEPQVKPFREM